MNQNCEIGAKIGCGACVTESTKIENREEKTMEKTNLEQIKEQLTKFNELVAKMQNKKIENLLESQSCKEITKDLIALKAEFEDLTTNPKYVKNEEIQAAAGMIISDFKLRELILRLNKLTKSEETWCFKAESRTKDLIRKLMKDVEFLKALTPEAKMAEANRKESQKELREAIIFKVKRIKALANAGIAKTTKTIIEDNRDNEIHSMEVLGRSLLNDCENYEENETVEEADSCCEWIDWKEETAHFTGNHRGFIVSICNNFQKAIRKGACGTIFTHHADKLVSAVGLLK